MKALIIGGTGPTGGHLINGLLKRGYDVTMLNRGSRDVVGLTKPIGHIIADPHFVETLETALAGRRFDLAIATYGRLRHVAKVLSDKVDRLISIGGMPLYRGFADPTANFPVGMPLPMKEDGEKVATSEEHRFSFLIRETENHVMAYHKAGNLSVTHFRYPLVYGPGQILPGRFWWVLQRCLDKRPYLAVPDGGLTLGSRGYAVNMAHAVLLAVDQPEASAGQIYNCADDRQFTLAQWIEIIADDMGHRPELISIPDQYASHSREMMMFKDASFHRLLDTSKIRKELGYQDIVDPVKAIQLTAKLELKQPPTDPAVLVAIRGHYAVEDKLIEIQRRALAEMAQLDHNKSDYHHSYAHPKKPGQNRDHLGR